MLSAPGAPQMIKTASALEIARVAALCRVLLKRQREKASLAQLTIRSLAPRAVAHDQQPSASQPIGSSRALLKKKFAALGTLNSTAAAAAASSSGVGSGIGQPFCQAETAAALRGEVSDEQQPLAFSAAMEAMIDTHHRRLQRIKNYLTRSPSSSSSSTSSRELDAQFPAQDHPAHLFHDLETVKLHFGMGCFASPDVAGIDALFRQQWSDFFVTEMVSSDKPLSRVPDFSVPDLPRALFSAESDIDEVEIADDAKEDRHGGIFELDVEQQLATTSAQIADVNEIDVKRKSRGESAPEKSPGATAGQQSQVLFLEAYLHKQHCAHFNAMSLLAQGLRLHPSAISVAGIKDLIGDTVQRVRLRHCSPASLLELNRRFQQRQPPVNMRLSNFSYVDKPLRPGDLYGNHFKIVLRDVFAAKDHVDAALKLFQMRGFPNYYGCQRFSWFGGVSHDPAFALLHHNWLAFAFRLLNYTDDSKTLRQLLQRQKKYPMPVQDQYRRNVVRRLRRSQISPVDLDEFSLFTSAPSLVDAAHFHRVAGASIKKPDRVIECLSEAFFDLELSTRRMTAARLSSFFWNQVLTLRLHYFGSEQVLIGDMVYPRELRNLPRGTFDNSEAVTFVTEDNIRKYTIQDVVHPSFSFENGRLPKNAVGQFYHDVCAKYGLDWAFRHGKRGLVDFLDAPRPIIRRPEGLSYDFDEQAHVLTVSFALERGCYANVAITELLKQSRCAGYEKIQFLPAPSSWWEHGEADRGYVTTQQDIYTDYEDGVGFVNDTITPESHGGTQQGLFDWMADVETSTGAAPRLFLSESEDPAAKAAKWSKANLVKNSKRREQDTVKLKHKLFEASLARRVSDAEVQQYAEHHIPLSPNANPKKISRMVRKRAKRFSGAPKFVPKVRMGAQVQNSNSKQRASFDLLNRNSWNVMW